ncbi:hypothetical protein BK129_04585 [Paenibacillus amylolyticus]|nr:hypothetical protein BK129_04585 [Paenibacillus amylolyticus]
MYKSGIHAGLVRNGNSLEKSLIFSLSRLPSYCYEGKLNLLEKAVLLLCWPEGEGFDLKHMYAFLSTEIS